MRIRSLVVSLVSTLCCVLLLCACQQADVDPGLSGPYLGQTLPGVEAEVFAPGIVSSGMSDRDVAMMPDGDEIYFGRVVGNNTAVAIVVSRLVDGRWTEPEVTPFCSDPSSKSLEPAISPDGQSFFFVSDRPNTAAGETEPGNWDIWVMDRVGDGWGEPRNLGAPVNSEDGEFFPSVTQDGTLYFTRGQRINQIYRSRLVDGAYAEPELLGPEVNCGQTQYNAFIAPDESYIIVPVPGREDSLGGTDYYIVYRTEDDRWSEPVHMGDQVNSPAGQEWSAYVSPDRQVLFFMSNRTPDDEPDAQLTYADLRRRHNEPRNGNPDIYWISAEIIETLRPEGF